MWLDQHTKFDVDAVPHPVFGIAANILSHHDSGLHAHRVSQILFTRQGCVTITLNTTLCLLPPTRAAWIPAAIPHRAQIKSAVDYRSVYFATDVLEDMPKDVEILEVSEVLRATLERIAQASLEKDWSKGPARNLLAVCMDEIRRAPRVPTRLPLPSDPRLATLEIADLPPSLGHLRRQIGASEKTIGRIFQRETGMSYQQWRQQWRLMKAVELLAAGSRVSEIAQELGFSSDSAFISFFKHSTGTTPRAYLRSLNTGSISASV